MGGMNSWTIPANAGAHHPHRPGWLGFIGHFVEMVAVMLIGMGVLSAVFGMPRDSAIEIQALHMAATMTVPMAGWMLIRRHTPRATVEMSAAMVLPMAALFPLLWTGVISADALLDLQHVLMLPAMLGAMLFRREEYGL
jgi:hypothetical protein